MKPAHLIGLGIELIEPLDCMFMVSLRWRPPGMERQIPHRSAKSGR